MRALYVVCFISIASRSESNENVETKSEEQNTTTLYPVKSLPFYSKDKQQDSVADEVTDVSATSKYNNRCVHFNQTKDGDNTGNDGVIKMSNDDVTSDNGKSISSKENKHGSTWEINATYAPSKLDNSHEGKDFGEDKLKDFKPSPHLGSFYDEDSFIVPTQPTRETFKPYSPQSFASFEKDFYKLNYKPPVDSYQRPIENPYRFENVLLRTNEHVKFETGLESRPTVEPPGRIRAGGLYKLPDAFQEKPGLDGDSQDFGLQFRDEDGQKDTSAKKRVSPWKGLLHLVTSLLPVGLIVSALSPTVITLGGTDNARFPSRISRRSDDGSSLPHISEGCKRRLLCEIHSDQHYMRESSFIQRRACYKIRCDNSLAMSRVLRWLLDHHAGYRPADHDRRGYII